MEIPEWIIQNFLTLVVCMGGIIVAYFQRDQKKGVDEAKTMAQDAVKKIEIVEKHSHKNELDILAHKLHVSENYCDKVDMRATLERIHNRIEALPQQVVDLIKGIK